MATEEDNHHQNLVPVDLPAPSGWSKKFIPKKSGTPRRKDIVFTSPTGEEIKSKSQLDQYLKSHPGGPSISEFDWSTGYTPRRSSRLSEESKGDDVTVAILSPKKKQKKSSTKGALEKSNADAEEETAGEKDAAGEEAKDAAVEDVIPGKPKSEDDEKKTSTQVASETPSAAAPVGTKNEELNASVGEADNATAGMLEELLEEVCEGTSPSAKVDESKEAPPTVPDAKTYETKEATNDEEETPDGKIESAVTASGDVEISKEKEAEGKRAPSLQEPPTTGS